MKCPCCDTKVSYWQSLKITRRTPFQCQRCGRQAQRRERHLVAFLVPALAYLFGFHASSLIAALGLLFWAGVALLFCLLLWVEQTDQLIPVDLSPPDHRR